MTSHGIRFPLRNRTAPQRPKVNGDENATSKHIRQSSSGALRALKGDTQPAKAGPQRPVLTEVTTTAVNRKQQENPGKPDVITKEKENVVSVAVKRSTSASVVTTGPQRVPVDSTRAAPTVAHARSTSLRILHPQVSARGSHNATAAENPPSRDGVAEKDHEMEVDERHAAPHTLDAGKIVSIPGKTAQHSIEEGAEEVKKTASPTQAGRQKRIWPAIDTERAQRYRREVDDIKETFEDPIDEFDSTMCSEYADEIFEYMHQLEEEVMPNPDYMNGQPEITWEMRETLVDWLLQVHLRYHMLPETLWIAINIVDRFLSRRTVSVLKLQLVGVTAMFIASKYEEILAPGVEEFVYITEQGYSRDEILKGERIVLQTLDFKISQYCSPYSWMRKISKADDYDIHTRTLSKFLTEVTLLDHSFLRVKPSLVAAVGMYTARRMLGGDWSESFIFHSGYTEEHLLPGYGMLMEKMRQPAFTKLHVCGKYANKKFLRASVFAVDYARKEGAGQPVPSPNAV